MTEYLIYIPLIYPIAISILFVLVVILISFVVLCFERSMSVIKKNEMKKINLGIKATTDDEIIERAKALSANCPIREKTADGNFVGRCWHHLKDGKTCPRHGNVSKEIIHYDKTGELTDEKT